MYVCCVVVLICVVVGVMFVVMGVERYCMVMIDEVYGKLSWCRLFYLLFSRFGRFLMFVNSEICDLLMKVGIFCLR